MRKYFQGIPSVEVNDAGILRGKTKTETRVSIKQWYFLKAYQYCYHLFIVFHAVFNTVRIKVK